MIIDLSSINFAGGSGSGGGGGSYTLPTATDSRLGGVKIGSGVNVDTAGTISVDSYQLSAATSEALGGIKVGSGLSITEQGVLSANGGGDANILEKITTLPESPVDGAVYNYNGTLIKYINGAGKWGEWVNLESTIAYQAPTNGSATLFYSVIPASMDGQLVFGFGRIKSSSADTNVTVWGFFNLSANTIDVYSNKDKTGTTLGSVTKNSGQESDINYSSVYFGASWNDNVIQVRIKNSNVQLLQWCSVTSSTAHYELLSRSNYNYPITTTQLTPLTYGDYGKMGYLSVYDTEAGTSFPGIKLERRNIKINTTGYTSSKQLYYYSDTSNPIESAFIPTAGGNTGDILVSKGTDSAPLFSSIATALGVDFWTGTQAEYDALAPDYSNTTLYFIKES